MTQLCLFLKMANCPTRFSLVSLGVRKRIASRVTTTDTIRIRNVFSSTGNPPQGAMSRTIPTLAPTNPSSVSQRYLATAIGVGPQRCCGRLFIPRKASRANAARIGTHTSAAFCTHTESPPTS